jgi:REP element-mobilizing transposase RayT
VLHRERRPVPVDCPVHVTLRVKANLPSLRDGRFVREWRRSLAEASERGDFRVNHYSLQGDHAHLIVEAHGKDALARGMKSIAAGLARALNRIAGRSGRVLDSRYHHRSLRSLREVRRALAYVLLNARRHLAKRRHVTRAAAPLDPASPARWFDGWRPGVAVPPQAIGADPEVAPAPGSSASAGGVTVWSIPRSYRSPSRPRRENT